MKFSTGKTTTGGLRSLLYNILQPGSAEAATPWSIGQLTRRGLALILSASLALIPMGPVDAFAQGQPAAQPLSGDQLDQLVAPIALYPDALVAQVLAGSTYPTQVVDADRWVQGQGGASADQIAAGANTRPWDPSVKALTAFPSVLSQLDKNLQWTTDLGNAYYNQPQDVMDAVQVMRQRAQSAGHLRTSSQEVVAVASNIITIVPANPAVVYVPVYNPWLVYGVPLVVYPGFYYVPPPGIVFVGGIGFGVAIGIGVFAGFGWGWGAWGVGWGGGGGGGGGVMYNHSSFSTHSSTVTNRGVGRPGGPSGGAGSRGAGGRSAGAGGSRAGGSSRSAGAGSSRAGGSSRSAGAGSSRAGGAGGARAGGASSSRAGGAGGARAGGASGAARAGGGGGARAGGAGGAARAGGGGGARSMGGGGARAGGGGGARSMGGGGARAGGGGGARMGGGGARAGGGGGARAGGGRKR